MRVPPQLHCLEHGLGFEPQANGSDSGASSSLVCPSGCQVPVVGGVPRFVDSEHYASSFGLQWRTFRRTQHDSFNGSHLSRERLERCLGTELSALKGQHVLEAGCGSGRFTELMLEAGASVLAVDLSSAVEANYENCGHFDTHCVCQANILQLPVSPASFDIVVCLGVVQHTPDPEQTISILVSLLKPGGLLVIDHYTRGEPQPKPLFFVPGRLYPSGWLRQHLAGKPPEYSLRFTKRVVDALWPLHRLFWKLRELPGGTWMRRTFLYYSPIIDGHEHYPGLTSRQLHEWAVLDTHDGHTDYYKHLRSVEEIRAHLESLGMTDIHVSRGGNGVEARGTAPVRNEVR